MEDSLTLDELELLSEAQYRKEDRHNKFMAAIQGIDLSDSEEETDFEKIKMRAAAELAGKSEEEFVFDSIGIEIEDDDD